MQAQVPTQTPVPRALPQQGNVLQSAQGWRKTWQTDGDPQMRKGVSEHILHLFEKKKPQVTQEWVQKLPDFVKRLEEALYRNAQSKEEYLDLGTLEKRLQMVAKKMVPTPAHQGSGGAGGGGAGGSGAGGMMANIPPGTMIPTPGSSQGASQQGGLGQTRLSQMTANGVNGMVQSKGSQMIPTPGLPTGSSSSGGEAIHGMAAPGGSQQQFGAVATGMYRTSNGQMASMMAPSGNGATVVNGRKASGAVGFANGSGMIHNGAGAGAGGNVGAMNAQVVHPNQAQYNSMLMRQQRNRQQQQQQHRLPGGQYALAGNVMGNTGVPIGLQPPASTPGQQGSNKMIPVPGIPSLPQVPGQQRGLPQQHASSMARAQQQQPQQVPQQRAQMQLKQVQLQLQVQGNGQMMIPTPSSQPPPQVAGTVGVVANPAQGQVVLPQGDTPPIFNTQMHQQQQELLEVQEKQRHALALKQQAQHQALLQKQLQQTHQLHQQHQAVTLGNRPSTSQHPGPQPSGQQAFPVHLQQHHQGQMQQRQQQQLGGQHEGGQGGNAGPPGMGVGGQSTGNQGGQQLPVPVPGMQVGQGPAGGPPHSVDPQKIAQYQKQQKWLLFLRHASKCTAPEGQCNAQMPQCYLGQQLWQHLSKCKKEMACDFNKCSASRVLLNHHNKCRDVNCPVCGPVRQAIQQGKLNAVHNNAPRPVAGAMYPSAHPGECSFSATTAGGIQVPLGMTGPVPQPTGGDMGGASPPAKRLKVEPAVEARAVGGALSVDQAGTGNGNASVVSMDLGTAGDGVIGSGVLQRADTALPQAKAEPSATVKEEPSEVVVKGEVQRPKLESAAPVAPGQLKAECGQLAVASAAGGAYDLVVKPDVKNEVDSGLAGVATVGAIKAAPPGKPKVVGVTLTELFTPQMIKQHIQGLRQWVGQSKMKVSLLQQPDGQVSENACGLCLVEKLSFEPPPIYCSACGARIKRNAVYYTYGSGDTKHYFCGGCHSDMKGDIVELDGHTYSKSRLDKKKNDEESEEAWVQCDKCNMWQHQICALFNQRRNDGQETEYICPVCLAKEMEGSLRTPLLPSAVLGAKDLPKTRLSDFLENRVSNSLIRERKERAASLGKRVDEVPGAEGLVIRVVSSVDKKLEVKPRFYEIFKGVNYPTDFPFKSKVVLLFQRIEGVEVCLFGMYTQEFGAECEQPNQRRVYLSYLDSVKYFRPEVKTAQGEALRTFVYHEILIGYLEYTKQRGFTSCYIWACPPLKGEDYILYCHPEIQKTPKTDKLREWYLAMLRKATSEGIVVETSNLYDCFFVQATEQNAAVTAARLPYFDGDYWPGAAEDMIIQLQEEMKEDSKRKSQKKGKKGKSTKRGAGKGGAAPEDEADVNASKDRQLMYKLGESIMGMKEDFIMVHMHPVCTHCRMFILEGCQWVCQECKNFRLCDSCYTVDQSLGVGERHPVSSKGAHDLLPVAVAGVPEETRDLDEIMESEFFDTRQQFLSLCQGNHYQYDTLRRAKHSSMMVLYHLHNPTAPAFVSSCNICQVEIETGQGWRCEMCPDFDVCNSCHDKGEHNQHRLTPHPSAAERSVQNKEARNARFVQLRLVLELLVHCSKCSKDCQLPRCRSMKNLFVHGMKCTVRLAGGCHLCKRMWTLLRMHAQACKETTCKVPRCPDLKEHYRRAVQQQESRRRAAVIEMMRLRAAEAAQANS